MDDVIGRARDSVMAAVKPWAAAALFVMACMVVVGTAIAALLAALLVKSIRESTPAPH